MSLEEHSRLHQSGKCVSEETKEKIKNSMIGKPNLSCRKLSDKMVGELLEMKKQGFSNRKLSEIFGINRQSVNDIVSGKSYKYRALA